MSYEKICFTLMVAGLVVMDRLEVIVYNLIINSKLMCGPLPC